jgi:hypothetical protein
MEATVRLAGLGPHLGSPPARVPAPQPAAATTGPSAIRASASPVDAIQAALAVIDGEVSAM